jgi:hypothetical protein
MRFRNESDKGTTLLFFFKSRKPATETLAMIRQAFGEESTSHTQKVHTHRGRKSETGEAQNQEHAHRFLRHQGDRSHRIPLAMLNNQLYIILRRFTATAWKCAKTSSRTLTTKELAVTSRQRVVSHFHFQQGILDQNQQDCCPHTPYFSLFPPMKIKLKGCHFDTIEVIEIESQAVQDTLTEHHIQDAFKKWQKLWKRCLRAEGDYFEYHGGH